MIIGAAAALAALALGFGPGAAASVTPACERGGYAVAVDTGHSPRQPGATSATGIGEFYFNQRLAAELVAALQAAGFSASRQLNADGRIGGLRERTRAAADMAAALFLSIHHDSVQPHYLQERTVNGVTRRHTERFSGHSLFVSARNAQAAASEALARRIGARLRSSGLRPTLHHAEPITGENRPLLDAELGVYRFDDLVVLHSASMPAVLIEAGIIVNRDEERALATPAHRQRIIDAVVQGVIAHCEADAPGQRVSATVYRAAPD